MANNAPDQTLIIEVTMPARQMIRFQTILQGEDGLAVVRCFDPEKKKQQLWTPAAQREELYEWLEGLPDSLAVVILGEWYWHDVNPKVIKIDVQ